MPDFAYLFQLLKRRRALKRDVLRLERELTAVELQLVALRGDQLLARNRRTRDAEQQLRLDRQLEDAIAGGAHARAVELATRATHLAAHAAKQLATETQRRGQVAEGLATRTRLKRELVDAEAERVDVNRALHDLLWGPDLAEPQQA